MIETTFDGLLNHRLTIEQPRDGYRIAVDTVLLAAAVPAGPGQRVLDLGCGVGGAMFCVGMRVPKLHLTGVEVQPELADIARRNARRNPVTKEIDIITGDVAHFNGGHSFDHVLMNPPYHNDARHDVSENSIKRVANSLAGHELESWLVSADVALKTDGVLTMIYRADEQEKILSILGLRFGRIEILPLLSKAGAVAKRIIIRATKNVPRADIMCPPFILHKDNGGYTEDANTILREAAALAFG